MATTVAHGLVGIAVYCGVQCCRSPEHRTPVTPLALLLAALAANIPDMDMLISQLVYGDHRVFHGAWTHTFIFAGAIALLVWLVPPRSKQLSLIAFSAVSSHVLVDWLTGPTLGLHLSHGIKINPFWPLLSDSWQLPVTLFKGVNHAAILPDALITALWELIILGPPVAVLVVVIARGRGLRQPLRLEQESV